MTPPNKPRIAGRRGHRGAVPWGMLLLGILAGAVVLILAVTFLTKSIDPPPSIEQTVRAFGGNPGDAPSNVPAPSLPGMDLYIDASESMRGFAYDSNARYPRVLRQVFEAGTTAKYNLMPVSFTSEIREQPDLSIGKALDPKFYSGSDTPLSALLKRVIARPDRIAVVLSDLVQSDRSRDQLDFVRALQDVAAKKMEIRLIGFRSTFAGDYFAESQSGRRIELRLSEADISLGRPFYLLVIAPNPDAMKRLDDYVLKRLDQLGRPQQFSPTDAPVAVSSMSLSNPDARRPIWNGHDKPGFFERRSGINRHYTTLLEINPPVTAAEADVMVESVSLIKVPVDSIESLKVSARRVTYNRKAGFTKPEPVAVRIAGSGGMNEKSKLTYKLTRPGAGAWEIYEILIRPGDGNLSRPKWVQEWSTDDDSIAKNGSKTFQLALLVDAMSRSITESNVFVEHYVALGRKK
ncbi:MAG: hypothetical protein ACKV2U_32890 [Bryobacteraceae bacterium]